MGEHINLEGISDKTHTKQKMIKIITKMFVNIFLLSANTEISISVLMSALIIFFIIFNIIGFYEISEIAHLKFYRNKIIT